ncbi:MAG: RNA polymerase sigma factor, partial [bacterium]
QRIPGNVLTISKDHYENKKTNLNHTPNSDTTCELVRQCCNGDRRAQFRLFEEHKDNVYNIAYRMSNDSQVAEDLTQKVFVQVFRKIHTFRGESTFSSWLYRITANICINHFRTANRWNALVGNELEDGRLNHKIEHIRTKNTEIKPHLEKAIRRLPEGYRMVFVLHDIQGYRHEEIGEMLNIAIGTSKSQLHKARKDLRKMLVPILELHRIY